MNIKPLQISTLKFALFTIIAFFSLAQPAKADIGSVFLNSASDTSLNVGWTAPSGNYQLSGSSPYYKICYKVSGSWVGACSGGTVVYSNTTNITLTGLSPNTAYKIKVYCHCEKKNWLGNWKNPKWRKIGVNVSQTSPVSIPNTFFLTNPTSSSLDVQITHQDMTSFDAVRICYKKKWTLMTNFEGDCGALIPEAAWGANDKSLGYFDVAATNPVNATVVPGLSLKDCTRYRVTGLGLNGGFLQLYSQQIGTSLASTTGSCGFWNLFKMIINDHDQDVLLAYAKHVDTYYKKPLFEHLAEKYDRELYRAQSLLLKESEDIRNTSTLLSYLIETDSETFTKWQQDVTNSRGLMTMEGFTEAQYPEVYQVLKEEVAEQNHEKYPELIKQR